MKNLYLSLLAVSAFTLTACNSGSSSTTSSTPTDNVTFMADGAACTVNTINESGDIIGLIPNLYDSAIAPIPDPFATQWAAESTGVLLNAYYAGGGNFSASVNGGTPVTGEAGGFAYVVADLDITQTRILHTAEFVVAANPFISESGVCASGTYVVTNDSAAGSVFFARVINCSVSQPTTTGGPFSFAGEYQILAGINGSVVESGTIGFTCPKTQAGSINGSINITK